MALISLKSTPPANKALEHLCRAVLARPPTSPKILRRLLKQYPKPDGGFFSKADIIEALRQKHADELTGEFWAQASALLKKPTRTLSGVTPITVLTKPHPCPGRCVFCPNDVRMPKSYLFNEPGSRRAWTNGFDPYRQVTSRLVNFWQHGHATDKVELIILGGTFTFYPLEYQRYFVGRCFEALNDFNGFSKEQLKSVAAPRPVKTDAAPDATERRGNYNAWVGKVFASSQFENEPYRNFTWERLERVHRQNETSANRCVGLVVETRPEEVTPVTGQFLRRLGCTKIQIGLQSNRNEILEKNKRGHTTEDNKKACELLRQMGFKIHGHVMVNLLGGTPESDLADFRSFFEDERLRPDELKIYPCSLVEDTELFDAYQNGFWAPYPQRALEELLKSILGSVPSYCRVSRMIRDFSAADIVVGNKKANLRQVVQRDLAEAQATPVEIRSREIRDVTFKPTQVTLRHVEYSTGTTDEVFLEFITPNQQLLGYLRLSLPRSTAPLEELNDAAIVRELHVYGQSLALDRTGGLGGQHRGYGEQLLEEAAIIAQAEGFSKLSVISGVGTRGYYRKKGFTDGVLYQHRALERLP